jgi:hypothetical protein
MTRNDEVTWFYSSIPPSETVMVEYGDHVLLSQDKVLHMYNLKKENSGQYLCKVGHTVMASYFLEAVNDYEPTVKASAYAFFSWCIKFTHNGNTICLVISDVTHNSYSVATV